MQIYLFKTNKLSKCYCILNNVVPDRIKFFLIEFISLFYLKNNMCKSV
jgi:hypothetical protein